MNDTTIDIQARRPKDSEQWEVTAQIGEENDTHDSESDSIEVNLKAGSDSVLGEALDRLVEEHPEIGSGAVGYDAKITTWKQRDFVAITRPVREVVHQTMALYPLGNPLDWYGLKVRIAQAWPEAKTAILAIPNPFAGGKDMDAMPMADIHDILGHSSDRYPNRDHLLAAVVVAQLRGMSND